MEVSNSLDHIQPRPGSHQSPEAEDGVRRRPTAVNMRYLFFSGREWPRAYTFPRVGDLLLQLQGRQLERVSVMVYETCVSRSAERSSI